jgi:hypothetical protein
MRLKLCRVAYTCSCAAQKVGLHRAATRSIGTHASSAGNNAERADRRPALPSNAYTRLVAGISESRAAPDTKRTGVFDLSLAPTASTYFSSAGNRWPTSTASNFSRPSNSNPSLALVVGRHVVTSFLQSCVRNHSVERNAENSSLGHTHPSSALWPGVRSTPGQHR